MQAFPGAADVFTTVQQAGEFVALVGGGQHRVGP
jgi:hypothetical protein